MSDITVILENEPINIEISDGRDGKSLSPKGEWSSSAAYEYLDLVSYNGSSYVAKKSVPAGTAVTDTAYWQLNASAGTSPVWGNITGDLADQTDLKAALDDKADIIHTFASGSLVHITDAGAYPAAGLSAAIEPVQDLHGYDNPWPAGVGKNLWKPFGGTYNGVTFTVQSDGSVKASGEAIAASWIQIGDTYQLSDTVLHIGDTVTIKAPTNGQIVIRFFDSNSTKISQLDATRGNSSTGTVPEGTVTVTYIEMAGTSLPSVGDTINLTLVYQMELGSSISEWTPYSNICPISGHSTAVVTRTGVAYDFESGTLGDSTGAESANNKRIMTKDYIPISVLSEASNVIGVYGQGFPSGKPIIRNVHFYQANNTWISRYPPSYAHNAQTITIASTDIPANAAYFRVSAQMDTAGTDVISPDGIILYVNSTSVTIDLDGTRYGGTLDVLTGILTVDREIVTYDGSNDEDWRYNNNGRLYIPAGAPYSRNDPIANYLKYVSVASSAEIQNGQFWITATNNLHLYLDGIGTVDALRTYLSTNNLTVCYKLATPLTVQLDPHTLNLLLGENNLWSDTGYTSVTYLADTKLYIDGKLAAAIAELQALILEH